MLPSCDEGECPNVATRACPACDAMACDDCAADDSCFCGDDLEAL